MTRILALKNDDGYFVTSWGTRSHFHESEIACTCGCGLKDISQDLLNGLERLRIRVTLPITVNSGVRCPDRNKAVRGAPSSMHLPDENGIGGAVDISCRGLTGSQLYLMSLEVDTIRGRGWAESYIHIDARDKRASWAYGKHEGRTPEALIAELMEKSWR